MNIEIAVSRRNTGVTTMLLAAGVFCVPRPAVAQERTAVSREPTLEACELTAPDDTPLEAPVLCGWYPVPEDRARPEGRWIRLRVVVVKSTSDHPEPDPLVRLFGGPGEGAASFAPFLGRPHRALLPERDLVLVDQRGTGDSNGLFCPQDIEVTLPLERVVAHVGDPESLRACRRDLVDRADLSMYHTTIAARDLAEVIEWLGYEKVNLEGGSYGTRMAQVFMRLYPERVRTATLDAVVRMDAFSPSKYSVDATDAFNRLLDKCELDPQCSTAYPRVELEAHEVLSRLGQGGVRQSVLDPRDSTQVEITVSKFLVGYTIRGMLYSGLRFPDLPNLIHVADSEGDFTGFVERFVQRRLSFAGRAFASGMYYSVFCTEDIPWITEADVAASQGTLMDDAMIREYQATCDGWPRAELPEGFHEPVTVSVPTLLFDGEFDSSTPPKDAAAVASFLPNALSLVIPGGGHGRLSNPNARECVQQVFVEFIRRGTHQGVDTTCVSGIVPPSFTLPGENP